MYQMHGSLISREENPPSSCVEPCFVAMIGNFGSKLFFLIFACGAAAAPLWCGREQCRSALFSMLVYDAMRVRVGETGCS